MKNNKNLYRRLRKNIAVLCGVASVFSRPAFAMDNKSAGNEFVSSKGRSLPSNKKGGFLNLVKENAISFGLAGGIAAIGALVGYNYYKNNKNANTKQDPQQQTSNPISLQEQPAQLEQPEQLQQSKPQTNNPVSLQEQPQPQKLEQPEQLQQSKPQTNNPVSLQEQPQKLEQLGQLQQSKPQTNNPVSLQEQLAQSHQQVGSNNSFVNTFQNQSQKQKNEKNSGIFDNISINTYDALGDKTGVKSRSIIDPAPSKNLSQRDRNVRYELNQVLDLENKAISPDIKAKAYDLMNGKATLYFFLLKGHSSSLSSLESRIRDENDLGKFFGCIKDGNNLIVYCIGRPKRLVKVFTKGTELMNTKDFQLDLNSAFGSMNLTFKQELKKD